GHDAYRADEDAVARVVREATGAPPRELRLLQGSDGLLVYVTIGLDSTTTLADAHARASELEELIRRARPDVADVIVHTEPGPSRPKEAGPFGPIGARHRAAS